MRFPPKVTSSCHTCFLIELIYIGMPVVRTDGHMTTKISRMHRLPMVLRCARARASLLRSRLTDNQPNPGKVCRATRVWVV